MSFVFQVGPCGRSIDVRPFVSIALTSSVFQFDFVRIPFTFSMDTNPNETARNALGKLTDSLNLFECDDEACMSPR